MAISDNARGLILAVSSSLFIGTSFILKKKGLKRAAAAGTRADIRVEVPSRVDELVELGVSALKPLHALSIELGTRGLPSAVYLFVWFASYYIGVGFTPCGKGSGGRSLYYEKR